MSDKEVLLGMGFDPARVECMCPRSCQSDRADTQQYAGALKATGNRGLQPAMDHLVENEGKPIPDLSSVSASSTSAPSGGGPMDVDEDYEDLEALKAVYGKKAGGSGSGEGSSAGGEAAGAEAKSIKCSVCGKTFKNVDLANYHAEKSGHDQFEESTEEVCRSSLLMHAGIRVAVSID